MNGKIWYERLPNTQLQGFDNDIIRDSAPPFMVLEKCQEMCLRDRVTNNIVRMCKSFDFQPGSRIALYNGGPEYEESTCYLTSEQAAPEGIGNLMLVPNSVHFTEVCITAGRADRECPNRKYIFERHPRKKLKLDMADIKDVMVSNRSECEDKCLSEFSFVCRSASFDSATRTCTLSRFTRRTHPEKWKDDPTSDYLENTCLSAERRCDGLAVFIKEENKRLGGPFEVDLFSNITLEECQSMCVRAEKYFCRSVEYDEMTKQCILSEEDSISQKDDIGVSSSPTHHFYDFACLDSPRGSEYPDNPVTSHLFTGKRPDTAFQRYRNSRLGGEHQSELSDKTLSECLDECLRQPSFQCRSAVYSERFRSCRLSRYNQRDGMRIIYDADYDYYENLMHHIVGTDMDTPERPQPGGPGGIRPGLPPSRPYPSQGDGPGYPYPPSSSGGSGYDYPSRYPPSSGGYDRPDRPYPPGRYPSPYDEPNYYDEFRHHGRLPDIIPFPTTPVQVPHRYPDARPPPSDERYGDYDVPNYRPNYPIEDRYGPGSRGYRPGDIYVPRYPGDRYIPSRDRDRYGPDRGRYPFGDRDRFPSNDRYPSGNRYRPGGTKYDGYDPDISYRPSRFGPGDSPPSTRYGTSNRYGPVDRYRPGTEQWYNGGSTGNKYGGNDWYDSRLPYDKFGDRYRPTDGYVPRDKYRPGDRFGNGYRYNTGNKNGDDSYRYKFSHYGDDRFGGPNYPFYPSRRPARPLDDRRPVRPISPGPDGPIYDDSFDGLGSHRPSYGSRCDGGDNFKQLATKRKIRKDYVVRFLARPSLRDCQLACVESTGFSCRSFNFREGPPVYEDDAENCELSDRDSTDLDLNNPQFFEPGASYNYYERSLSREADGECLDVSQVCNEDGMEFTLRTREGFFGRIYAYGYYDRCFFRGNGGTVNVLRISGSQGYPECGTQRYGDTMTNIVVVQFSDNVQTDRDKRFNLTCLFRGPGEAIVTSSYIGAGSGSPIPIEYLPAENTLSSKVRLLILYQGRPTTTIAVGDPLTFRLEAQDGYNYITDIFATNVVARDPYTGRSVQLIDKYGCPVDAYVFPELDRGRNGDTLEANFNAFKIPESNYLIFEANVRTCKDGCQPAYCPSSSGRSEASFGRRRRSLNDTLPNQNDTSIEDDGQISNDTITITDTEDESESESPEQVRELIEVRFTSTLFRTNSFREELQLEARRAEPLTESVCITPGEYQGLISAVFALTIILITISLFVGFAYRRYWSVMKKNVRADRASSNISSSYPPTRSSGVSGISIFGGGFQKPFSGFGRSNNFPILVKDDLDCPEPAPGGPFEDPSEPIYTDPSLFERSRSLRSIAISQKQRQILSIPPN
ncbi:hypothetical protein MML48_2g00001034 [Holotrichia oblita]|uniref:Uncharacterized protein n=1 Tax=Holotrichia oblita TaxID=644536 RepID=A0ACB9TQX5_HOLOL|nr:hypothetical protein MML48_2g00001034 [Holotrichia oblita]